MCEVEGKLKMMMMWLQRHFNRIVLLQMDYSVSTITMLILKITIVSTSLYHLILLYPIDIQYNARRVP